MQLLIHRCYSGRCTFRVTLKDQNRIKRDRERVWGEGWERETARKGETREVGHIERARECVRPRRSISGDDATSAGGFNEDIAPSGCCPQLLSCLISSTRGQLSQRKVSQELLSYWYKLRPKVIVILLEIAEERCAANLNIEMIILLFRQAQII